MTDMWARREVTLPINVVFLLEGQFSSVTYSLYKLTKVRDLRTQFAEIKTCSEGALEVKLENTTDRDRPTYGPTHRPTDIHIEGWTGGRRKYCYIGQACISTDERTN